MPLFRRRLLACSGIVAWWLLGAGPAANRSPINQAAEMPAATARGATTTIPYAEAKAILAELPDVVPAELKGRTPAQIESAWSGWVSRRNAEIHRRLERGDDDSLINFWYYGTSFTKQPRLSARNIAKSGPRAADAIVEQRLDDLIAGIEAPGRNERLQFARDVVERRGIDPTTAAGNEQLRRFLLQAHKRIVAEREARERRLQESRLLGDPKAEVDTTYTFFRDRGLSSDTSMSSSFSIDVALESFKSSVLSTGSIRRLAIIGPGLDFTDKADGYDFYPQQTTQPFALVDSLMRLGLASPNDFRVTTFDLSPRINRHIDAARRRASAGTTYLLQLPLDRDEHWNPALIAYWRRFGDRIGEEVKAIAAPPDAGNVEVRAIGVRPDVVASITPQSLNVVLERVSNLPAGEQFDLIVATNILVYYDIFEQNLALANVATMLRRGGLFVTNTRVFPSVALKLDDEYVAVTHRGSDGDRIFFYQRQ